MKLGQNATRDIAKGDVVVVFGKTATDVHEFQALVDSLAHRGWWARYICRKPRLRQGRATDDSRQRHQVLYLPQR